jgi:hypothetical protein
MKVYGICHGCHFKAELNKAVFIGSNLYHKNCYKRDVLRVGTGKLELINSQQTKMKK